MWEGLRKPTELLVVVVTLLAYGCPRQAIVHASGLDERTVASWRDRAGTPCQGVPQALSEPGNLDLVHVQADAIRVKGRSMIAWMGLTLMVSTRLWLGGAVSLTPDTTRADRLMCQVRTCAQALCAVLVCTAGWAAYPGSIKRAKRRADRRAIWTRTSALADLARGADRHRAQPDRPKAGDGRHPSGVLGHSRTGTGAFGAFARRKSAHYRVARTVQRDPA
jgi:hypothetical protein